MRVGLAGAGRIGEVHLRNLATHPDVSEVLLYDPDGNQAEALGRPHGARSVVSVDALLDHADAVVIASPTRTHVAWLDAAMGRGLPAFCEKPVASTLTEVEELAARAEERGAVVQVGFHYRFDPVLRDLAGRVSRARTRFLRVHSTTEFAPTPAYLSGAGGLIADKLVHELDMIRWLGGSEVVRVTALPAAEASLEGCGPMTAALTLELADGGLVAVWGGYGSVTGFDLSVEVETPEAVFVVGNRRPVSEVPYHVQPNAVADFRDRFVQAYHAELNAFLALVRGAGPNLCDLGEAVRTQRLVVAAQAALDERRVITVGSMPARADETTESEAQ